MGEGGPTYAARSLPQYNSAFATRVLLSTYVCGGRESLSTNFKAFIASSINSTEFVETSILLLYSHYATNHHCTFHTWYFLNVRNKFFPPLQAFKNFASGELRLLDVSVRHTFTDA